MDDDILISSGKQKNRGCISIDTIAWPTIFTPNIDPPIQQTPHQPTNQTDHVIVRRWLPPTGDEVIRSDGEKTSVASTVD